jgi:hypothetical protein
VRFCSCRRARAVQKARIRRDTTAGAAIERREREREYAQSRVCYRFCWSWGWWYRQRRGVRGSRDIRRTLLAACPGALWRERRSPLRAPPIPRGRSRWDGARCHCRMGKGRGGAKRLWAQNLCIWGLRLGSFGDVGEKGCVGWGWSSRWGAIDCICQR